MSQFSLGIDIGGTFTDFTLVDKVSGEIHVHKRPSTPASPSEAVGKGLVELLASLNETPDRIDTFVHGTTIGLNAILQRTGARVALIVSEGTRDLLEIGRLTKREKLNLKAAPELPLVPRHRIVELPQRIAADGSIVRDIGQPAVAEALSQLAESGVDVYGLCLLNAHAAPAEEERIGAWVEELTGLDCSRSTALWPEMREYERAIVTVLNAYVQPIMARYVDNLYRDTSAIGLRTPIYITRSNGGIMSAEAARRTPVDTLLSGPASGVVGAAYIAALAGIGDAVTVDIGGTSADVSLIRDNEPVHSTEAAVGDYPLVMPSVDVFSVGAGGGSIASVDRFGLLKVGPQSAGAVPGPACYGLGGTEPTLTDAYVVCGYIDPDSFLGGDLKLDPAAARAAIEPLAKRLGIDVEATAEGILDLATTTMSTALLPLLTKRGVDPREFTLIPFGGAGATHACLLADDLRIGKIVVPPSPGTLCALGASIADAKADYIRSVRAELSTIPHDTIQGIYVELADEARQWLEQNSTNASRITIQRSADMRYVGQAFSIEVALPEGTADNEAIAALFHEKYEELYRNSLPGARIELINLRTRIVGRREPVPLRRIEAVPDAGQTPRSTRSIRYGQRDWQAAIYDRADLGAGQEIRGPAIIEQFDTTTVVAPHMLCRVDEYGLLTIIRASDV